MRYILVLLLLTTFPAIADLFSEEPERSSAVNKKVDNNALDIFQEELAKEGDSALDALDRIPVKRIEKQQVEKQQEKKQLAKQWAMPDKCHCVFNLCLTAESYGTNESWEERKAKKKAAERYKAKLEKTCRRWARNRDKYGPAAVERELQALTKEHQHNLASSLAIIQARKQKEEAARQAYLARINAEKEAEEARRQNEKEKARAEWHKQAEQACARLYQKAGHYCFAGCPLPEKQVNCKILVE
jgi:hypothetical protein